MPISGRLGAIAVIIFILAAVGRPAGAQESGWHIDSFAAEIAIQPDGELLIVERIDVTFDVEKRGIIRDIPVRYEYDDDHVRVYKLDVLSVTDAGGHPLPYQETLEGEMHSTRIGDPDVFLTGPQSYWITYEVDGAINTFPDHYELYWNVTGTWPVPVRDASAVVKLEGEGITRGQCYVGDLGSTEPCGGAIVGTDTAGFSAGRGLGFNEQFTVVTAIDTTAITEPALFLEDKDPNPIEEFLGVSPATIAVSIVIFAAGLAFLVVNWWRGGRDRVYTTLYYLSNDTTERTRPPFARREIVVEYTPPEDMAPAKMGLLLDERADERDLTATIIDLAVRGHLMITETQDEGFLRDADWRLDKKQNDADALAPFERSIYDGLFGELDFVKVSQVKPEKYGESLRRAQNELYDDSVKQGWFPAHPDKVRRRWQGVATSLLAVGGVGGFILGNRFGLGLLGVPVAALAVPMFLTSGAMPRRTAKGSEALRRVLGFRLFIETAESRRAEFAEKANLFTEYLPHAIVFGSADKWAEVFADVDITEQTRGWYAGGDVRSLTTSAFSSRMLGFSSGVASLVRTAAADTPGGRGSSGFSFGGGGGGFSGGGGGGGGGRSW